MTQAFEGSYITVLVDPENKIGPSELVLTYIGGPQSARVGRFPLVAVF
jgi:hypothetical protein